MAQCGHFTFLPPFFFHAPLHLSHALFSLKLMVNTLRCRATVMVSALRKLQMPHNEISQSMDVNQWHRGWGVLHQKTVIPSSSRVADWWWWRRVLLVLLSSFSFCPLIWPGGLPIMEKSACVSRFMMKTRDKQNELGLLRQKKKKTTL